MKNSLIFALAIFFAQGPALAGEHRSRPGDVLLDAFLSDLNLAQTPIKRIGGRGSRSV